MDRLIAANSVPLAGADVAPVTGTPQYATDGNPAAGVAATLFPAYQYNALQEELMSVLTAAGIAPDRTNFGQLLASLNALFGSGRLLGVQVIESTGSYIPTPGMGSIIADITGGGAGAGGVPAQSSSSVGSSGGGGPGVRQVGRFTAAQVAAAMTGGAVPVTVGAGGAGGAAGANAGHPGGTSSFGTLMSAPGGMGSPAGISVSSSASNFSQAGLQGSGTGGNLPALPGVAPTFGFCVQGNSIGGVGGGSAYGLPAGGGGENIPAGAATLGSGGGGVAVGPSGAALAGGTGGSGLHIIWEYA